MSEMTKHFAGGDSGVDDPGMPADTHRFSGSVSAQDADQSTKAANDDHHGARETEVGAPVQHPDIVGATIHATGPTLGNRGSLIDAVEALAGAILEKIDPDRPDQTALPMAAVGRRPASGRTAASLRELGPLIDAVEAQVREIRHELGLPQPRTLAAGAEPASQKRTVAGVDRAADREPRPLIDAFETQIRGIRRELGVSSEPLVEMPVRTTPDERTLPPAPAKMIRTLAADRPEVQAVIGSAPALGHARSRRWPWLIATVAILLLVAAAVGGRLTRDGRLPTTAPGRPPTPPPSVSTDRPVAIPTPAVEPPARSGPSATALPGPSPIVPSGTGAADNPRGVPSPVVEGANSTDRDPAATRSIVTPVAPVAVAATPSPPPASEVSRPATNPELAGAVVPDVGPPAGRLSANDGLEIPNLSSPVTEIAASPAPAANSASLSLTRPAAVLTRVQPRMRVDVLSDEMSAVMEVEVEVDRTGRPNRVRAVSGPAALRAQAEDLVGHWTFSPALQGGETVEGALRVSLRFGPAVRDMRFGRRSR